GPVTPARSRWQNDIAAARRQFRAGGAAAGADRAQRARFHRVRARCGAFRSDGGGQGMTRAAGLACIVVVALSVAACTVRRWAPVVDRGRSSPPAASVAQPVPSGSYMVKRGDTLYSIALDNGADYRDVAQWNGVDDPTKISVG